MNKKDQVCVQTLVYDDKALILHRMENFEQGTQVRCNGLSLQGNFRAVTVVVNRVINFAL